MNKQIKLWRRNGQGWVASFLAGGQPDPEVVAACGTHQLPTAYTSQAPLAYVHQQIALRNPEHEVIYDAQNDDHRDA